MRVLALAFSLAGLAISLPAAAANRPANFTTVCNEGKYCSFTHFSGTSSVLVAFGRAGAFRYARLRSGFLCSATTFGGRVQGGVNECSVNLAETPYYGSTDLVPGSIVSGPSAPAGYVECALQGQRCQFSGSREVVLGGRYRFGSSSSFWSDLDSITRPQVFTNGVDCKGASFAVANPRIFDRCYIKQVPAT